MLAAASSTITVAIVLAAAQTREYSPLDLAVALLSTASALAFLRGLAPPRILRMAWRRPEQERLQEAVVDLMAATNEQEVAERVLPPMASIVGARAVALQGEGGRVIGVHGCTDEMLDELDRGEAGAIDGDRGVLRLDVPSGSLVVWTSPYAPYFGSEELKLLETLGALTGLALDRSRLFAQEREARLALERADELKTNFVALAAHELRTPVASVHGIVETMHTRGERLSEEQRGELRRMLRQQTARLRALVEQLLDLSRLDAEAVSIAPERFPALPRVEELVEAAAGERAREVEVAVSPDLEIVADPVAFDRIVTNLVTNALRYGEAPVIVRAEQRDRHFRVTVEDRGPGVAPEFVPDLFERFTRSEPSRGRPVGSGLGLAIARSYARAHRGELLYEQANPRGAPASSSCCPGTGRRRTAADPARAPVRRM